MPNPTQGGSASSNGHTLERTIVPAIARKGFKEVPYSTWRRHPDANGTELLLTNVPYTTIYGSRGYTEFLLISGRLNLEVRIECKWQQVPGSVDEKFPYLYINCVRAMPEQNVIIVIGGVGARQGAIDWLDLHCRLTTRKSVRVMDIAQFLAWTNTTL